MKIKIAVLTLVLVCSFTRIDSAFAQIGTAFTYQGQLLATNGPAHGLYDLEFSLYGASSGGSALYGPVTTNGVFVTNGLFTVLVDFGAVFSNSTPYWLQIGVRTNGAASYTALSGRQQLTPTPYAIYAEGANAAGLAGTIPTGDLSGTYGNPLTLSNPGNVFDGNGNGLTDLNAANLTGTLPGAVLPANVALLNANQIFTGVDTFSGPGESFIVNTGPIMTTPFTGIGLQYYTPTGEGAIMSSYNDGYGFLTFYTKQGTGYPIAKQVMIDKYGGVAIDQQNYNNGVLNNGTTNGVGLTFGIGSGEGIASKRTAGGNQYGLDFYTSFSDRMSIAQSGTVLFNNDLNLLSSDSGLGHRNSVAGVTLGPGGDGPFLWGFDGGALGTVAPDEVNLTWDYSGNVWISNNLSVASLTIRGPQEFFVVPGLTPVQCYIGDDGVGNDVQIGSLKSGITALAAYNAADNAYMHFYCSSITIEGGADLAEPFKITSRNEEVPQGAVVVIDDENPGHLKECDEAYDTRVAGVVSGANGISPGIQMQQQGILEGGKNVALTGRVYVRADASYGAIRPGDFLTTSTTPGYAMKVTDHAKAEGAILGKAMTGLRNGRGMVLVLVTLQ
ncbi:MAG TPA: hypothetical protein VG077_19580 [Verrucomicrobiae bacterium]|nr:hypothetical protein [Verrucomicrobiae bacterium]